MQTTETPGAAQPAAGADTAGGTGVATPGGSPQSSPAQVETQPEWILREEDIDEVFRWINITEPKPITSTEQARLFVAICEEMWPHAAHK